jgi:undecaprenyl-diphosphatase
MHRFAGVSVAGLAATVAAGVGFALLLLLVRDQWKPLESMDHNVAVYMNRVVGAHHRMQAVLQFITAFGSTFVLSCIVAIVAIALIIRRRARLAAYLVVTGVGALIMGPALKLLVGRLRPVVEQVIIVAPGNSFPSGHSLGSFTCYGALLLVFLPALSGVGRRLAYIGTAVLIFLIGFSRVALGVHFVSDVLGGWLLAAAWLFVTAAAFEAWRRQTGRRPTAPIAEGLEPEAARDVHPAPQNEPPQTGTGWRGAAGLAVAWIFTFGVVLGIGQLVSRDKKSDILGDETIPHWLAMHRTAFQNSLSDFASQIGSTPVIIAIAVAAAVVILAATRHWRPALFLVVVMFGEITLFLGAVAIVNRERPDVDRLDGQLPTSSYPSGHLAATICLYGAIALLVLAATRRWWRWIPVAAAVLLPLLVTWGRLYRGMHHPTDLAGSLLLAAGWLAAAYLFIRPFEVLKQPAAAGARRQALPERTTGRAPATSRHHPVARQADLPRRNR